MFFTKRNLLILAFVSIFMILCVYHLQISENTVLNAKRYGDSYNDVVANMAANSSNILYTLSNKNGPDVATRLIIQFHDIDRLCNESQSTNNLSPLEDFGKFPCIPGLPIFPKETWSTKGRCVRTFCYNHVKAPSTNKCVSLKTLRGKTPICTYPSQTDIHVSASLQRTGQWEGGLVTDLARFIRSRPNMELLDLGCNIGVYTLSLAHLGIKVTAVDPLVENLQLLSQSLRLGKLHDNVTLIWNAVSNDHYLVKFTKGERNVGGTQIADVGIRNIHNTHGYFAGTVILDDLLPLFRGKRVAIKMDIEKSEYRALLGGAKFLDEVDVSVIQIEMLLQKKETDGVNIFKHLQSKGFYPYRDIAMRGPLKSKPVSSWPNDVYFLKSHRKIM